MFHTSISTSSGCSSGGFVLCAYPLRYFGCADFEIYFCVVMHTYSAAKPIFSYHDDDYDCLFACQLVRPSAGLGSGGNRSQVSATNGAGGGQRLTVGAADPILAGGGADVSNFARESPDVPNGEDSHPRH